ncbi:MAG: putative Ig domain-containing protein, partial [Phycisphaerae bacterium]
RKRDEATKQTVVTGVKSRYALSQPGLLTPDTKYYWRVKAKDAKGLWGPWSRTFRFTARGVAQPIDLAVNFDTTAGAGTLKWKANPVGAKPAKYRVYASDEKGFTVADRPFQSTVGVSKKEMGSWAQRFPANFVAETDGTQMVVIGPDAPKAANKAYYRVVAVDAQGKRSGPSDYATGPRPVIHSRPVTTAKVGQEYSYEVCTNRSLGDLTARMMDKNQRSGYFDIEKPQFAIVKGPAWLKIDGATGVLSGTPDAAGKYEVEVTVTIDRKVRKLDESKLIWGLEKVLSETTERVGVSTQKFVIDVQQDVLAQRPCVP